MRVRSARRIPREMLPANLAPLGGGPNPEPRKARLVLRPELEAEARAKTIVERAENEARAILHQAERAASGVRLIAEAEGRANGAASVAAQALKLAALEREVDNRNLDRSIALARLLAERLIGAELSLQPERIAELARTALRETGGARQVVIHAHPEDARVLEATRETLGLPADAVRVQPDIARGRGSLRLDTEIGVLDAELAPQLERLSLKLRETLGA
ncbi:MAG: FliH/SctL family protein [Polyangiaceae bacterium]